MSLSVSDDVQIVKIVKVHVPVQGFAATYEFFAHHRFWPEKERKVGRAVTISLFRVDHKNGSLFAFVHFISVIIF